MRTERAILIFMATVLAHLPAVAQGPRVMLDGCQLELVAREPQIVTPVGMVCDPVGRLLVIESHTHQRQKGYDGPPGDRVRMLSDSDGDGTLDRWSTFAEGLRHAMNLAVHPDGGVLVVTRRDVQHLRDTNDDGVADERAPLLRLETDVDYPHNGLSGIAVADDGTLYVGLGENFGGAYRLVGSDDTSEEDAGGAGTIFHCQADGSQLARYATGFWNPFSLCVVGGELFCVDNDPDASPPCRLIHVVERGDYGFRWDYGRAGVHPLQAWDGELPGTLPMLCGTGEAPTAVLAHRGYLWVTSWGEHRIERYQLVQDGEQSVRAERVVVVQGEADFRPTGMAVGPDGSLYFADWVDRHYAVHGKGRVWRLELPDEMQTQMPPPAPVRRIQNPQLREMVQKKWGRGLSRTVLVELLRDALGHSDADIRLFAVRWAADEYLTELRDDIAALLEVPPPSDRYYLAVLSAIDWLDHDPEPRHSGISDGLLARELRNERRGPDARKIALRLISPDYPDITLDVLVGYLRSTHEPLRLEAVRTLAMRSDEGRLSLLAQVVRDDALSETLRAEALVGISAAATTYRDVLIESASGSEGPLSREARRVMRLTGLAAPAEEELPPAADLKAWNELLAKPGDADAGRRVFFSPLGPRCASCHRHRGRGSDLGPDLTGIAEQMPRERIISSILDPSRDIAPRYQGWLLQTTDGRTHMGLRLPKAGDDGVEHYADPAGKVFELPSHTVEVRQPLTTSVMPAGLEKSLTIQDLRDLLTFLMAD